MSDTDFKSEWREYVAKAREAFARDFRYAEDILKVGRRKNSQR